MKQFDFTFFRWAWLTGLLLVFAAVLPAQQLPQYSLFSLNPLLFNAAYAGLEEDLLLDARWRSQWLGPLPGKPQSGFVSLQMPVYLTRGGVGLQLSREVLGAEEWLTAGLAYNFQGILAGGKWSLGARLGYEQQRLPGQFLRTPDGVYEGGTIDHRDDRLQAQPWQAAWLTAGLGAFWLSERGALGLSIERFALSAFAKQNPVVHDPTVHLFFYGAYRMEWGRFLLWEPALLVKTDLVSWQTDLSSLWTWNGNISAGLALRGYDSRSLDALIFSLGYQLNEKWRLMYAYDWTVSGLRRVSDGSHELWIQYALGKVPGKGKLPPVIYSPRF